jgi:hypothetical protein
LNIAASRNMQNGLQVRQRHQPAYARRRVGDGQDASSILSPTMKLDQEAQSGRVDGVNLVQIEDDEPLRS